MARSVHLAAVLFLFCFWCAGVSGPAPAHAAHSYREAQWEELVPPSWNPESIFEGIDLDDLEDDDPRAVELFDAYMEAWKNAPVNQDMDGQRIKIPGFIAPLDWEDAGRLKEFLLVPYFGACIHVPPPPPNQIIYVALETPLTGVGVMEAVWVYGELTLEKKDSGSMGTSGYSMKVDRVELYKDEE